VAQDASNALQPSLLLIFRASVASIIFLVWLILSGRTFHIFRGIERVDILKLIYLGILNIPMNQLLYLEGIKYTTPANSALLYAMTPALVFLFTLLVHREAPSLWKITGIIVAFTGVALIIFEEEGGVLGSQHTLGNILIFVAVVAWSLYTMYGRDLVRKYGALRVTGLNMILGTLIYLPIGVVASDLTAIHSMKVAIWEEILYLGIFASVINYVLWFFALGRLQTSKVAIFQNLQPVMTTIMALALGKVVFTLQLFGGGILALIGVIIVQFAN